jgi:hypothetical protein
VTEILKRQCPSICSIQMHYILTFDKFYRWISLGVLVNPARFSSIAGAMHGAVLILLEYVLCKATTYY